MLLVPILTKFSSRSDNNIIHQMQDGLLDDLKYCRVLKDQIEDLTRLLYFIERTHPGTAHAELTGLFETLVQSDEIDLTQMNDKTLQMFTWVHLSKK